MVDKSKIPGTKEYIESEKTDYVLMPEKKLKLSKGVRPAAIVPLATKQYYDKLDQYGLPTIVFDAEFLFLLR